jgi:hypothetical protein
MEATMDKRKVRNGKPTVITQVRMDEDTHARLKDIADREMRSMNAQLEYFVIKGIEAYEAEAGITAAPPSR